MSFFHPCCVLYYLSLDLLKLLACYLCLLDMAEKLPYLVHMPTSLRNCMANHRTPVCIHAGCCYWPLLVQGPCFCCLVEWRMPCTCHSVICSSRWCFCCLLLPAARSSSRPACARHNERGGPGCWLECVSLALRCPSTDPPAPPFPFLCGWRRSYCNCLRDDYTLFCFLPTDGGCRTSGDDSLNVVYI